MANTEELHERIEALQERITQLEGGLLTLHHAHNGSNADTHPLLTDELLNIKTPIGAEIVGSANPRSVQRKDTSNPDEGATAERHDHEEEGDEVVDSFGTLALGEGGGKAKFFGVAAGAHYLLGVRFPSPSNTELEALGH